MTDVPNVKMNSNIYLILREMRREHRWPQRSLAFHLGVCTSHLRDIELGRALPSPQLEIKIKHWLASHIKARD